MDKHFSIFRFSSRGVLCLYSVLAYIQVNLYPKIYNGVRYFPKGDFLSGNFLNVQFSKRQVPKAVRSEAPCYEFRAKRLEQGRGRSAASRTDFGSHRLGNKERENGYGKLPKLLFLFPLLVLKWYYIVLNTGQMSVMQEILARGS